MRSCRQLSPEWWWIVAVLAWLLALPTAAHEVRPAALTIVRQADDVCRISWKQPTAGTVAVRLEPRLSGGWLQATPRREVFTPGYRLLEWRNGACERATLERQSVHVEGLDATITDVLVRVDYGDGDVLHRVLRPGDGALALNAAAGGVALDAYFRFGVKHILEGVDHLAFVLGLVLLVGFGRRLLLAVTGFTLAHSLTLAATALGWVVAAPALIEALVALSILVLAAEVVHARHGRSTLGGRWPVLLAAGFGLLHGAAFAGALAEIGLPRERMLEALLLFNLGVEVGQVAFIVALLPPALLWRRIAPTAAWLPHLLPYGIGGLAGFWFLQRSAALWF